MGEKNSKGGFALPNEIVTVKFINRRTGMAAGEHINKRHVIYGGMLNKSSKRFQVPRVMRNGTLFNVLTDDEKEYLEKLTGFNLSIYGDFWKDFFVTLRKEDTKFDLSVPIDYISYKVLKAQRDDISPTWGERHNKQTYQFVLTKSNEELTEKKKKLDNKKKAFKLYGKIEDEKHILVGILNILSNKNVSSDSSLKWLQAKVEEIVDSTPSKFIDIVEDPAFFTRMLVNKGIEFGVIKRKGNLYSTVDGLSLCEEDEIATFDNAVKYLDNPKYQEIRSLVTAKIENAE